MSPPEGERPRSRYRQYLVTIHDQSGDDIVKWCTKNEALDVVTKYGNDVSITGPTNILIKNNNIVDPNDYSLDE
ncbi:MAG: hypothetical protein WA152_03165 [Microgenomates group bacterium]